jgi:hypothetical protein
METWEPKHPVTLWATPGLLRDCFLPLPLSIRNLTGSAPKIGTDPVSEKKVMLFLENQAVVKIE